MALSEIFLLFQVSSLFKYEVSGLTIALIFKMVSTEVYIC